MTAQIDIVVVVVVVVVNEGINLAVEWDVVVGYGRS